MASNRGVGGGGGSGLIEFYYYRVSLVCSGGSVKVAALFGCAHFFARR